MANENQLEELDSLIADSTQASIEISEEQVI